MIQTEVAYREALAWAEECIDVISDGTINELIDLVISYKIKHYPIGEE